MLLSFLLCCLPSFLSSREEKDKREQAFRNETDKAERLSQADTEREREREIKREGGCGKGNKEDKKDIEQKGIPFSSNYKQRREEFISVLKSVRAC